MLINTTLFRRVEIQLLMNLTARALGKPAQRLWTLPCDEALRAYADFTRDSLHEGVTPQQLRQLNDEAYRMGRLLRRGLHLKKQADVERTMIALYRHIGIKIEGHWPGTLCFRHCFFSQFYTSELCQAASALDDGIMRGLVGSGHLSFQQRITQGCKYCIATFE